MQAIKETNFQFDGQTNFYRGKVRDVYYFGDKMAVVASDRISAFDVILPRAIPLKGTVLNQVASKFLQLTSQIVPNWLEEVPDPNVSYGKKCTPYAVEMVIRGYLAGHAWREYRAGKRSLCGVPLPEGLKENDQLPEPIITPSTKAKEGHDMDISREEILSQGLVAEPVYQKMEQNTRELFQFGSEYAASRGLILVDTKYEFGDYNGTLYLIDEVHTPDSSRYFYQEGYQERQNRDETQKQLSKEFVRQWLIASGFQGKSGQAMPVMDDEVLKTITDRYLELFEQLTGEKIHIDTSSDPIERIHKNILKII